MAENQIQSQPESVKTILVRQLLKNIDEREYVHSLIILKSLAKAQQDKDSVAKIDSILSGEVSFFPPQMFEQLYAHSFQMDPRRRIVIRHTGMFFSPLKIRQMFEQQIIAPTLDIFLDIISRMATDKSIFIEKYIEGKTRSLNEIKNRQVDVILDDSKS